MHATMRHSKVNKRKMDQFAGSVGLAWVRLARCPVLFTDSQDVHNLQRGVRGKAKNDLSRDEAAIIIQKQIRGSIARKHYGPMVKAATGKLDAETVVFMKTWCKKWKLKSIFQVLLLYRATRHQDLVYFCQQVHLYNQNFLSELQFLNEDVDLKQIDPKAKADYLPFHRPAVHKLPFRLMDLPHFDSNYICDPTRDLSNLKQKDADETWDAPLQRNIGEKYKRSAGLRNFREQGCQTYMDQREYTAYSSGYSLPETPFVRENVRGVKLPLLGEDKKNEFKGRSHEFGKSQVYKGSIKKTAPMPTKDGKPAYGPIHEMSEKFRQTSGDEDNPPFNFQAMLRKTNNKRESLKRAEGFISPAKNYNKNQNNNNESSRSNKNNNNNTSYTRNDDNVVFQSNMFDSNKFDDFESNNNFSKTMGTKSNVLELAPGVVIHGEVADL